MTQENKVRFSKRKGTLFLEACYEALRDEPLSSDILRPVDSDSGPLMEVLFEADAENAHNLDYTPHDGEWLDGCFVDDTGAHLMVEETGNVELVGDDGWCMDFSVQQPQELLEFINFYRNAVANVKAKSPLIEVPLIRVISQIGMPIWVDDGPPRLLRVTREAWRHIPEKLQATIFAHLRNDCEFMTYNACPVWPALCRGSEYADILLPLCDEERMGCKGFRLKGGESLAPFRPSEPHLDFTAWAYMEPDPEMVSTLFFSEFFGHSTEGTALLADCFGKSGDIEDLFKSLSSHTVKLPSLFEDQVCLAIEARCVRNALRSTCEFLCRQPAPIADLVGDLRDRLAKIDALLEK